MTTPQKIQKQLYDDLKVYPIFTPKEVRKIFKAMWKPKKKLAEEGSQQEYDDVVKLINRFIRNSALDLSKGAKKVDQDLKQDTLLDAWKLAGNYRRYNKDTRITMAAEYYLLGAGFYIPGILISPFAAGYGGLKRYGGKWVRKALETSEKPTMPAWYWCEVWAKHGAEKRP